MKKRKGLTNGALDKYGNVILVLLGILFAFHSEALFYVIGGILGIILIIGLL